MREINASAFKAKCLALLDEIAETGEPLTILKRGTPVAQLFPPAPARKGFPQEGLKGSVRILGDVVDPVLDAADWEVEGDNG